MNDTGVDEPTNDNARIKGRVIVATEKRDKEKVYARDWLICHPFVCTETRPASL
ncbi:hypothetical protein PAXRUDRAFT_832429 [Paxillus rubicundulus Ve08.2h10]|uniref:Uncharacterized protein n=1 Tax=Paxillus rubicundulus Ve08.2h10 TaxID=930991 RepID=A0A0D0DCT7_9AGAM|nr:hypothetical protein PAXRUDRAFT_832429 [Paxillus rubicundulus Ve08.2h10]